MVTIEYKKQGNGKKSRSWTKYPRGKKVLKNFEGTHISMGMFYYKELIYHKGDLKRFLISNAGRPVDKVFSEYLKRCDSSIYDAKKYFYEYIDEKDKINPEYGGFYVSNGILNYVKRRNVKKEPNWESTTLKNKNAMPPEYKLLKILNEAKALNEPIYLGKFYIRDGVRFKLRDVAVCPSRLKEYKYCTVQGIGVGLTTVSYLNPLGYKHIYRHGVSNVSYSWYLDDDKDTFKFIIV